MRLFKTVDPTLRGLRDAPTTAMDDGSNNVLSMVLQYYNEGEKYMLYHDKNGVHEITFPSAVLLY
jgi:hypothetical protein